MIKGIHHTGLAVKDLDASIKYFSTSQSFELVSRAKVLANSADETGSGIGMAAGETALLKGTSGFLELFRFDSTSDQTPHNHAVYDAGIRHICIQHGYSKVGDLFDAYAEAGSSSHNRPAGLGTGALYCYIRDPEGNVIELEGVRWGENATISPWYTHTAIVTHDIARLTAFYEKLTGTKSHRRGSFGPNDKFDAVAGLKDTRLDGAWIRLAHGEIELWEYHTPRTEPAAHRDMTELGWNHICFEVDDIDQETRRLETIGIEVSDGPGRHSRGTSVYGRDPDGNIFELFQPAAAQADLFISSLAGRAYLEELKLAHAG